MCRAVIARSVVGMAATPTALTRRDPAWIDRTVPADVADAEDVVPAGGPGLDRIPADGPVLLVGNHSGGNVAPDTLVFTAAFIRRFGTRRPFFQLAHKLVTAAPWLAPAAALRDGDRLA